MSSCAGVPHFFATMWHKVQMHESHFILQKQCGKTLTMQMSVMAIPIDPRERKRDLLSATE